MRYINVVSTALGLLLAVFSHFICYGNAKFKPSVIENAKRSVVSVGKRAVLTAYTAPQESYGSGVVIDKQAGYILTSGITVGPAIVADYTIDFFNGVETKAKVIYYDPWVDFSILKVDPSELPKEVQAVKLSSKHPFLGQSVFTIAREKNKNAIVYTGSIDDMNYSLQWTMPQHCIRVSMPSRSNAVGSFVFNEAGEGIALNCASSDTADLGLHLSYVCHALSALKQKKLPVRKHIGALLTTYLLDDAIRYDHLPQASQKEYCAKFPNARNKILQVENILKGTPAADKLFPGDVIWAINGGQIGPNLVTLDMAMNSATSDHVLLTIFRMGQWHDIKIGLYDLNLHKITKMVHFGGAIFFEMDDYCATMNGIAAKSLTLVKADVNHIFNNVAPERIKDDFRVKVLSLNKNSLANLQELVTIIPSLMAKKYFTIEYTDLSPFYSFGSALHLGARPSRDYVEYGVHMPQPRLFIWDEARHQWNSSSIL